MNKIFMSSIRRPNGGNEKMFAMWTPLQGVTAHNK